MYFNLFIDFILCRLIFKIKFQFHQYAFKKFHNNIYSRVRFNISVSTDVLSSLIIKKKVSWIYLYYNLNNIIKFLNVIFPSVKLAITVHFTSFLRILYGLILSLYKFYIIVNFCNKSSLLQTILNSWKFS